MCRSVWGYTHIRASVIGLEDAGFPEAGAIDVCELPNMDSGNLNQVLYMSTEHSSSEPSLQP